MNTGKLKIVKLLGFSHLLIIFLLCGCATKMSDGNQLPDSWELDKQSIQGCLDLRNLMFLVQANSDAVTRSKDECQILSGYWFDIYSGKTYQHTKNLDIDFIVPLNWAYDHGGKFWDAMEVYNFVNDRSNLLVASKESINEKSGRGVFNWLPEKVQFRCTYILYWEFVLNKYPELKLEENELKNFENLIDSCS